MAVGKNMHSMKKETRKQYHRSINIVEKNIKWRKGEGIVVNAVC